MRSSRPGWARNRSDDSESGWGSGVGEATRVGMRNPRVERDEVFPHHPEGRLGHPYGRRSAGRENRGLAEGAGRFIVDRGGKRLSGLSDAWTGHTERDRGCQRPRPMRSATGKTQRRRKQEYE
jgi:hypothetical protein